MSNAQHQGSASVVWTSSSSSPSSQQQQSSHQSQRSNTGQSEGGSSYYSNTADSDNTDLTRATAAINLASGSNSFTSQQRLYSPTSTTAAAATAAPSRTSDESAASSQPLRPSTSFVNGTAADPSGSRNRSDMDRIKSRAVDPGWSWEKEREKHEAGSSIRSNSIESRPSLPSRGSSRPMPRLDTSANVHQTKRFDHADSLDCAGASIVFT